MREPRFTVNDNWTGKTTYLTTQDMETALFLATETLKDARRKEQERGYKNLHEVQRDDGRD